MYRSTKHGWAVPVLRITLLLVVGFAPVGCSSPASRWVWRQTGPDVPALSAFDETMKEFIVSREVSAGALAITYRGRLVFARGYTWAKADSPTIEPTSLFRIASLSKPITSAAVLRLVEDKRLKLDDRVLDALPFGPPEGQSIDPNLQKVTILHLLQHLGGWDRDKTFDPMFADKKISKAFRSPLPIAQADIITFMNGQPLQYEPGTKYAYSNYGYCLLGRVIEQKTSMRYEDYVQNAILSRLGIHGMQIGRSKLEDRAAAEARYDSDRQRAYGGFNLENMDSHGGWLASAPQLVRFASAFDDPCNCPILSAASIEAMFALPQTIARGQYKAGEPYYACGWNVRDYGNGRRNTWHTGSLPGTYSFMARWANGVDCVALFNRRTPDIAKIDGLLRKTVESVANWPDDDLFAEMLETRGE
ncbi:MAG TPA: serine hydrolase domain-containing protein [Sedimentisphaerales bacterium]|nr:serine hydrolase domain-containing protein [Sedimentisphaerales bacterium]